MSSVAMSSCLAVGCGCTFIGTHRNTHCQWSLLLAHSSPSWSVHCSRLNYNNATVLLRLSLQPDEAAAMAAVAVALLAAGGAMYAGVRVLRRVTSGPTDNDATADNGGSSTVQVRAARATHTANPDTSITAVTRLCKLTCKHSTKPACSSTAVSAHVQLRRAVVRSIQHEYMWPLTCHADMATVAFRVTHHAVS
eukprot:6990-Heterococcus_DN1.PRE.7